MSFLNSSYAKLPTTEKQGVWGHDRLNFNSKNLNISVKDKNEKTYIDRGLLIEGISRR